MKDLVWLERRIRWSEWIHLTLLTLSIAFPSALLFSLILEEDEAAAYIRLIWAIGTVIPVHLIRFICERVEKKAIQCLLCLGVLAVTLIPTFRHDRWVHYLVSCLPILISGLFLPRPQGKLMLTVPKFYHLLIVFLPYAIGKVTEFPLLCRITIVLSALLTLNFFLHLNHTNLLKEIRMSVKTEVSAASMIRQNRKVTVAFVIAGILVLAAIPFLFRNGTQQTAEEQSGEIIIEQTPSPTPVEEREYMLSPEGKPIHLEFLRDIWVWSLVVLVGGGIIVFFTVGLINLFKMLRDNTDPRRKHTPPKISEDVTIERLKPEPQNREREHLSGYEKKIRRHYEKLIRKRAPKEARLTPLTPTELEAVAEVSGNGADAIHDIYSRTRYSTEPATRESYAAFKDAIRTLSGVSHSENEPEDLS